MSGPAGRSARRPPPLVSATSASGARGAHQVGEQVAERRLVAVARARSAPVERRRRASRRAARARLQRGRDRASATAGSATTRRALVRARRRSRRRAHTACGARSCCPTGAAARVDRRSRSTRPNARPTSNDSMIGMPATRCAMPAWVWPATIDVDGPVRQRARDLEDLARRSRTTTMSSGLSRRLHSPPACAATTTTCAPARAAPAPRRRSAGASGGTSGRRSSPAAW